MRLLSTKGHYGVGLLSNPVHLMMDTEQNFQNMELLMNNNSYGKGFI
jgi:hypothetical protein